MVETQGMVHFTIPVSDLERSAKFYSELLGMRILLKTPSIVFLKCGGDYVNLGKGADSIRTNMEGKTIVHHAFKVAAEDFEPAMEFLKEKGVEILRVEERDDGVFQGRMFYFRDPDGNVLEIHDSQKLGFS